MVPLLLLLAASDVRAEEPVPPPPATAVAAAAPELPWDRYTLENGLEVILSEDHDVPVVRVEIWYHVGSGNERPGRTGFAHLFEHLMFQGSLHADQDYFVPLQEVGAEVNGSTNLDRTNYYEQLPSRYLPLALWMEADRMGFLLPALTEERLRNQKDVVRNERRQNYETRPYGDVWITLLGAVFPEGHPYHHPTIGSHEDIEAATLDDVRAFFETYYTPANATLAIVGDFDPAVARRLVDETFGALPAAAEVPRPTAPPVTLHDEAVIRQERDVPQAKVWLAWPTPALFAPGDADLDVLAGLLAEGKDSRLYRTLVHEEQVAREVSARQSSYGLQSIFLVTATPSAGHTTDDVVAAVDRVLAEARAAPPEAFEVAAAVADFERGFVEDLATISRRSSTLLSYDHHRGDPGWLAEDLARYRAVTPASVQEAASRWLPPDRRVVLHVLPQAATEGVEE